MSFINDLVIINKFEPIIKKNVKRNVIKNVLSILFPVKEKKNISYI